MSGAICQVDGSCTGCSATGLNECAEVYITGPDDGPLHLSECKDQVCAPAATDLYLANIAWWEEVVSSNNGMITHSRHTRRKQTLSTLFQLELRHHIFSIDSF